MSLKIASKEINRSKVAFFRFKKLGGQYLVTNDIGEYCFLSPYEFDKFITGEIERSYPEKYNELKDKRFIKDQLDVDDFIFKYSHKNNFLSRGPGLHIIVVTLRCDHKCIYCQTSSKGLNTKGLDMSIATAQKVVDVIFESPNPDIAIEFQGGEPLVNWSTVKFIVSYAQKKNKIKKKKLFLSLVSNFTFLTKERLDFLMKNDIALCTSLDGPQNLHNKNRKASAKINSYKKTTEWIKKIQKSVLNNKKYKFDLNALPTITRFSLSQPREIIDEFIKWRFQGVHLRRVSPFGSGKKVNELTVNVQDFLKFYRKAMDYIIDLNLKGKIFYERTAQIFLKKILLNEDPNFLDIRSPCGAGIGQLAYNFNGDVYTCDEGRMLSAIGDKTFRLGNVSKNVYKDIVFNDVVKSMCLSSCLENLPVCNECVYKPYCGVCPIYNYVQEGNFFSATPFNDNCVLNMSILTYLFDKLQELKVREIFLKWVNDKK